MSKAAKASAKDQYWGFSEAARELGCDENADQLNDVARRAANPRIGGSNPSGHGRRQAARLRSSEAVRNAKGTTAIGYTSKNRQTVVRKTGEPGNDHNQTVYVLRCGDCGHEYGANGSDIWQRRCSRHDGGAPGLSYTG